MRLHEFTIIMSGLHPDEDDIANIFFDAGCDDAVLSFQKGALIAEFEREAMSFASAVASAVRDVMKTGSRLERIEPDHLVSLADIAKRSGLTRAALTNYHQGARGANFPTPKARVTSESPLWDWYEVASWLHSRQQIDRETVVQARIVRETNLVLETQAHQPDHLYNNAIKERLFEEPA